MRYIGVLGLFILLIPAAGFAASQEQQEMQRDIAQLQDQVRTLQSGFDQKMAALQTLVAAGARCRQQGQYQCQRAECQRYADARPRIERRAAPGSGSDRQSG